MVLASSAALLLWRSIPTFFIARPRLGPSPSSFRTLFCSYRCFFPFCSLDKTLPDSTTVTDGGTLELPGKGLLKSGLYLVGTLFSNFEDITLRALRILKSADIILTVDIDFSEKLLQHLNIETPLLSYHKFVEYECGLTVLRRLKEGEAVALISDAGFPGIRGPSLHLVKMCVGEDISVFPIPGPSILAAALSGSGFATNEFTFVGAISKLVGPTKNRLAISANEQAAQVFLVRSHKLHHFIGEASSFFSESRQCVIAQEMTTMYEKFWRGSLGKAKEEFSKRGLIMGENVLLIVDRARPDLDPPAVSLESELEDELRDLISRGHSLSLAAKVVAEGSSASRSEVYSLALKKFGNQS